jgi:murein L,D-transpeptidase YafK
MKKFLALIVSILIIIFGILTIYNLTKKEAVKLERPFDENITESREAKLERPFDENITESREAKLDIQLPEKLIDPKIVIYKEKRELDLYSNGNIVKRYKIGLGNNSSDDKLMRGDRCTPEGEFYICTKNNKSRFYLSLGISYPNIEDAIRGLKTNLINKNQYQQIYKAIENKEKPPWNTKLGGEICIHGRGSGCDWTRGCIALDDNEIKEIFNKVDYGTTVIIKK